MKKQLLMGTLAAATLAASITPAVADDGLSASAAVASAYLWRGTDLGDGSPAVSGDIHYSLGGAYVGTWISSGDSYLGNEYDLYAGYGFEVGGLGVDLSVWNYNYDDGCTAQQTLAAACDANNGTFGDSSEVILGLSMAGVNFKYYNYIAGTAPGDQYYTLSYGMNGFSGLVGFYDQTEGSENYTHLNLSYAFNDNLTFTASKMLDAADKTDAIGYDEDMILVVSYSLPIN